MTPLLLHPSQYPEAIRRELHDSLRSGTINHRFHYDSPRQTLRWLSLHEKHSPARHDRGVQKIYRTAAAHFAAGFGGRNVTVISLGCGGGHKDLDVLRALGSRGVRTTYAPADISAAMVTTAREHIRRGCHAPCAPGLVVSLTALDMKTLTQWIPSRHPRLFLCFGILPNFPPRELFGLFRTLCRPGDALMLGANLAPGTDFMGGMRRILPQYDNREMREWLCLFPRDHGLPLTPADIRFSISPCPAKTGLYRIDARARMTRGTTLTLDGEKFRYPRGRILNLFYSYRHQPSTLVTGLVRSGFTLPSTFIAPSGEEGVCLTVRSNSVLSI
ncbi:MAG: L-histidine N(alpha)-methyltransferase [Verrucomicrobiae bacterium]|nr:L-histidine N(alpha)-methyltransferase [Verrucomicrobiae bacterium]